MPECSIVLITAFTLDIIIGDPVYPLHPVRLIGKIIVIVEALLRRIRLAGIIGGMLLVLIVVGFTLGIYLGLRYILHGSMPGFEMICDIYIAYSCIAFRDLLHHANMVAKALDNKDIDHAREQVQKFVGRDAGRLDAHGVARAAVESAAENFVDGLLSPIFWYVIGAVIAAVNGLPTCAVAVPAMLGFRTINTLDSMVGYRNEQYLYFGRAAARLDDAVNFIPARLAIPIISFSALLYGLNAGNCIRIGCRDRLKHESPNSAHAESCVAGALEIRLGGPTIYAYGIINKPWLGDGIINVSSVHIKKSGVLIFISGVIASSLACVILIMIYFSGVAE